jgi:hypothetical protein
VHNTTRWLRAARIGRDRAVPRLGASGAPQHVREDPRCGHEVFRRRELRRGRRDSSPSAPPSVVLELRLTVSSQQKPATFAGGFSATRVQHHPEAHGPLAYVLWPFAPPGAGTFSRPYFQLMDAICFGFVIILYSNRTRRPPLIPTLWPRQQPPAPPLQLPTTDIPSSSTPPLFQFQAQRGGFDTGTEDQLAWDEFRVDDVLATMEATPQQADKLAASQFTQPPPVLTQLSQLGTDGATTGGGVTPTGVEASPAGSGATPAGVRASPAGGGATPAGVGASPAGSGATPAGRATPDAAGSSQAAMATLSPDQLAPRVVRPPDPWTYDWDHTWAGARAVRGKRGRRI